MTDAQISGYYNAHPQFNTAIFFNRFHRLIKRDQRYQQSILARMLNISVYKLKPLLWLMGFKREEIIIGKNRIVTWFDYHYDSEETKNDIMNLYLKRKALIANDNLGKITHMQSWAEQLGNRVHQVFSEICQARPKSGYATGFDNTELRVELKNRFNPVSIGEIQTMINKGDKGLICAYIKQDAIIYALQSKFPVVEIGMQLMPKQYYDWLIQNGYYTADELFNMKLFNSDQQLRDYFIGLLKRGGIIE